jgi:streptomycin 6-kinase
LFRSLSRECIAAFQTDDYRENVIFNAIKEHPATFMIKKYTDSVIKTTDPRTSQRELCALRNLGPGMVTVMSHRAHSGSLQLERIDPGTDLRMVAQGDDEASIAIIAQLIVEMQSQQTSAEVGFARSVLPDLGGVLTPLVQIHDSRIPSVLSGRALTMGRELVSDESASVLILHGDLHPGNVLWDERCARWRVIDPHGWVGDPIFEAVVALCVPDGLGVTGDARGCDPAPILDRLDRRVSVISEITGFDRDRLTAWAFVGAVIAEARMIERHNLVHGAALAMAEGLLARECD